MSVYVYVRQRVLETEREYLKERTNKSKSERKRFMSSIFI